MIAQSALLVFARSAGFLFKAPGFSHPSVPAVVRVGIALALAMGVVAPDRGARRFEAAELAVAVVVEFAIGAAIGYGAAVLYEGAYAGGRLLDDYVGIRGAVPTIAIAGSTEFGRLWSSAFVAAFFLLNAHLVVIGAFASSFARIPPGAFARPEAWFQYALTLPGLVVHAALFIAGPAIAITAGIQIALAAVSRIAPRFGNFTLPFPVVFGAVVLITLAAVPLALPQAAHPLRYGVPLR